jgi:GT2 family glycosyltransferase
LIKAPLVSIIVVTHNNQDDIIDCINSVLHQNYPSFEVIIVDNASTDKTVERIQENFGNNEMVRVVNSQENTGYAHGNNLGFQQSKGELIVILNPDLTVDKSWLGALVECYCRRENAGIVGSSILLFDDPNIINACGNDIHLTGFVLSRFYREDLFKCCREEEVVAAPSGASFIFSRKNLNAIGRVVPFDDNRFVLDCSDADLAIDFLSHDLLCYVAPSSKVFHRFRFKMNPQRLFILESGRYQILGHLRRKTLVMMLPSLILAELIVWYFILKADRRLIRSKIKVQIWLFRKSGNIFRNDNSSAKDLKIIENMISDIKLYYELSGGSHSVHVQNGLKASNRLFRFTKQFLINSLYTPAKNEAPNRQKSSA